MISNFSHLNFWWETIPNDNVIVHKWSFCKVLLHYELVYLIIKKKKKKKKFTLLSSMSVLLHQCWAGVNTNFTSGCSGIQFSSHQSSSMTLSQPTEAIQGPSPIGTNHRVSVPNRAFRVCTLQIDHHHTVFNIRILFCLTFSPASCQILLDLCTTCWTSILVLQSCQPDHFTSCS